MHILSIKKTGGLRRTSCKCGPEGLAEGFKVDPMGVYLGSYAFPSLARARIFRLTNQRSF